jgi:two-component system, response regulator
MGEPMRPTFLVAEDDEDDYALLHGAFEKLCPEAHVIWVRDGEELTEVLFEAGATPPSLLLLDLSMPRKDGREALKEIRERGEYDAMPIIVLTTSASDADLRYVSQFRGTSHVTKPVGISPYEDLVRRAILMTVPPG